MVIYNVTVKIDTKVHDDWLNWMKAVHVPDVMATGLFDDHRICRILGEDETEGVTYAIQYHCRDLDTFREYQEKHASRLQTEHRQRFPDQYVAFRTLLQEV